MQQQTQNIDDIARELAGGLSLNQLRKKQSRQTERIATPPTQTEVEYWSRVFAPQKSTLVTIREFKQEMDYEDARVRVWYLMQARALEISALQNRDFEWQLSDMDIFRIRNLIKYFINDPGSEYPLHKGLFVCGMPGTGKTELMQIMKRFCDEAGLTKRFAYTDMSSIYLSAKTDPDFDPVTSLIQSNRCFDEFGRHIGSVIRYGEGLNINEAVIEERYKRFNRYGQITHFVANMSTADAEDNFPAMIFDRLRAMCTSVVFAGQSKRQ